MKPLKHRRIRLTLILAALLMVAAGFGSSRFVVFHTIEFALERRLWPLLDVALWIGECRFSEDPDFKAARGVAADARCQEEWGRAVDWLDKAIASPDVAVHQRIRCCSIRARLRRLKGDYAGAISNYWTMRDLVTNMAAKGEAFVDFPNVQVVDELIHGAEEMQRRLAGPSTNRSERTLTRGVP
jgi:hypothetical protein